MSYELLIGDRAYSSWSLRGWLLFERFGIPFKSRLIPFSGDVSVRDQMAAFPPARTVPTVLIGDGATITDSLAIAEELASRHPEAGIWPSDPTARAIARNLACEMHSGFSALRTACPMSMRVAYQAAPVGEDVKEDLRRIEALWDHARAATKPTGPWLCGDYSAADAFYAPVAARIAGYGLSVSASARAYVDAHLNDPAFRRWRAMGLVRGEDLPWYAQPHTQTTWPGPTPLSAHAVDAGPSVNEACPYSGLPVTDFLEIDGIVYGFCNPFCRDKTVPDPLAWPAFASLHSQHSG